MSRAVAFTLALLALAVAPGSCNQSSYTTSTTVWDLQQQLEPITLDSGTIYVSGTGVRLSNTASSGQVSFSASNAPFAVNNVVPSWNVDMPDGTGIRIELRAVNGGSSTAWYEVARQGTTSLDYSRTKSDSYGKINDDTLELTSKWPKIEYRVTLFTNTIGATPTLRLMALCYADSSTLVPYVELSPPGYTTSLPVPWRAQGWSTLDPGSICGPTSLSMAMAYDGCNLRTETVASEAKDTYNNMYGNWPFLAQEAARHGFKSYYSRANNQQPLRDHLAAGYPAIIGMVYSAGQLTNSPISSTNGHLVLCVGVASNGDYICNDPAGSDSRWDHVVYLKDDIATVWLGHAATVIPCIPNSVYWRYPYFPYKSSDPVSTNRDGRLELFARSTNSQIYHMWQTSANGAWTAWSSMGGTAASDPVAVTNRSGGNSVFARFADGNLYYASQNGASGGWSSWTSLGGPIAGKPCVGKSPDGRMDVFCRMADGTVQHRWEDYGGGWQAWSSLGGSVAADPVVGLNWEGREEVFVRGTDNQLYHKWQLNDGSWSGWASLGGDLGADPSVGMSSDGRIEVYCKFSDGSTYRNWQNGRIVGTSWNGWQALPDSISNGIAVGRTPEFTQDLYYRDHSGQIVHISQSDVGGGFVNREVLPGSCLGTPIVGHNDDGTQQLFTFDGDGRLYGRTQRNDGSWTASTAYGSALFTEIAPPHIVWATNTPPMAAGGDSISVSAYAYDNVGVASVTANGTELADMGGGIWSGAFPASSEIGGHTFRVQVRDTSGNTVYTTRGYKTVRAVALTTRAIWDAVAGNAVSNYLFAVCGRATNVTSDQFSVDDGSGRPIVVYAADHGVTNGEMVRARGKLVKSSPTDAHIESSAEFVSPAK